MASQPQVEDIDWTLRREELEESISTLEDSIETLEQAIRIFTECNCMKHDPVFEHVVNDLQHMVESMHTTRVELHIEKSQLPY